MQVIKFKQTFTNIEFNKSVSREITIAGSVSQAIKKLEAEMDGVPSWFFADLKKETEASIEMGGVRVTVQYQRFFVTPPKEVEAEVQENTKKGLILE